MKKTLKTITLMLMVGIILLTLTGCANVNFDIKLNADGSGEVSYVMGYDKSFLTSMGVTTSSLENDDSFKEMEDEARQEGYTVKKYEDDNTYGFKATKHVENIQNEVATTLQATNIQKTEETDMQKPSISLSVDEKNKNQIHWRAEDTGSGVYKVVLPNGEATVDLEGTYTVPKTGMYTFSVVDKVGNTVKQNIHINTEIFLEKSLYKMTFMI